MSLFYLFVLAVVQGITEFLPISSSAHLALLHELGGTSTDDLALDVAVHLGSIGAVILYLRGEALGAFRGLGQVARLQVRTPEAFLALCLIVATVPAVIFGTLIAIMDWAGHLRDVRIIGWMMILFGIALWWVHRVSPEVRHESQWTMRQAAFLGLWQAVSLIPGVSRSGITMTAARGMGFERHAAARISMLMSIPITLATGALLARDVIGSEASLTLFVNAAIAAVLAFAAAYGALALMMRYLSKVSFTPYVIYRIILGVALLIIAYS